MKRLPPLNSLKAFEAAVRHLSFTAAAAELHVTHGAVSRQIATLEEQLQLTLFIRSARGLKLTREGAQLAGAVSSAFTMLRSAVEQLQEGHPVPALRVSVPPTFAMRWLIPRMTGLHHAHPRLRIELSTSIEPVNFEQDPVDAAIRRVVRAPQGMTAMRFLDGRSVPVCSPSYQAQHRLRSATDLERATLIVTGSEPGAWTEWLRRQQVARRDSATTLALEQLYFALQAALDSLGVALIPVALVAGEIKAGRLHALAPPDGPVAHAYALLSPRVSAKKDAIHTFAAWLKEAASKDDAS